MTIFLAIICNHLSALIDIEFQDRKYKEEDSVYYYYGVELSVAKRALLTELKIEIQNLMRRGLSTQQLQILDELSIQGRQANNVKENMQLIVEPDPSNEKIHELERAKNEECEEDEEKYDDLSEDLIHKERLLQMISRFNRLNEKITANHPKGSLMKTMSDFKHFVEFFYSRLENADLLNKAIIDSQESIEVNPAFCFEYFAANYLFYRVEYEKNYARGPKSISITGYWETMRKQEKTLIDNLTTCRNSQKEIVLALLENTINRVQTEKYLGILPKSNPELVNNMQAAENIIRNGLWSNEDIELQQEDDNHQTITSDL